MDQLVPVLFVVGFIAFILMKQIKHVTDNMDNGNFNIKDNTFEKYANFSVVIQNAIRAIKKDLDSSKEKESVKYILLEGKNEEDSIELLSDFLRKLVFFETLLAKQKSKNEIESELFTILDSLDTFIQENCKNGEELAQEFKNDLFEQYEG